MENKAVSELNGNVCIKDTKFDEHEHVQQKN